MSAEIEWSGDFDRFLDDKADAIETALRAQMGEATTNLLSYIKDQKLSGQVLNQRTGNLKNSGHATTSSTPTEISGEITFGSGPTTKDNVVPYAAIQNYGGTIPAVEDKLMVFEGSSEVVPGVWSKDLVFTRRHRAFQLPARNYLETSFEEREPSIIAGFQAAVDEAAK
jgi:hypothetical protein